MGGGEIEDPCKEALENGAPTSKAAVGGMITGQLHGKQGECGSAKTIGSEEACGQHGTHAGCGAAIKEVRMRERAVDGEPERAENQRNRQERLKTYSDSEEDPKRQRKRGLSSALRSRFGCRRKGGTGIRQSSVSAWKNPMPDTTVTSDDGTARS